MNLGGFLIGVGGRHETRCGGGKSLADHTKEELGQKFLMGGGVEDWRDLERYEVDWNSNNYGVKEQD